MRNKWSDYGIAVWVTGLVLLAEGLAELLNLVWHRDYSKGAILIMFSIGLLVTAWKRRSERHP